MGWPQAPHNPPFDDVAFTALPGQVKWVQFYDNDGTLRWQKQRWLYNNTGGTTTVGKPYVISYAAGAATIPQAAAMAALAVDVEICVALTAVASGVWSWMAVEGYCEALCDDVGAEPNLDTGDYIQADTSLGAFKENGTTRTANSFGNFVDATAQTAGVQQLGLVYLNGGRAQVVA